MNMSITNGQVAILGLGGAGGRVVESICQLPESANLRLGVFDTDRRALEQLTALPDACKYLCGEQWLQGMGAGGDVMKGQRAISHDSSNLQTFMQGAGLLVVVGGLGGGTATGCAGFISRMARSNNLAALSIFEMPFSFEGHGRCQTAENALRELIEQPGTVIAVPNDLLFSVLPAETAFADAFRMADKELARAVLGVIDVVTPGNLLSADMGDLAAVLKSRKNYAAVGVGMGNEESAAQSCITALNTLMDSPFLGGAAKLKEADAVILNLTGGEELSISDVRRTLESAGTLPGSNARVLVGVNMRKDLGKSVHLTAIAVKYDEREAVAVEDKPRTVRKTTRRRNKQEAAQPVQQMLPLTITSCGIFEGRTPTIIDGVNYDIPAFVRRQVSIDSGE